MYIYDEKFFACGEEQTREIANIMMAYIINWLKPRSVVDFGCGEGIWLKAVKDIDSRIEIFGLDGDYINRNRLKIPISCFKSANLEQEVRLEKKYNLAMSLEVAEHLNEKSSDVFVDSMIHASDNILFSAAIPKQGGENHINEQWQSYWIEKFEARGYSVDITFRNHFWKDERITPWRRQNILFFSRNKEANSLGINEIYDVVHPQMYEYTLPKETEGIGVKGIYCKIDEKIKSLIQEGHKQFVIYPFGQNGFLCKEILNYKYLIKELAIADNNLHRQDGSILSANQITSIQKDYCIIENCSNPKIHKEVLTELRKYVESNKIFSIFEVNG